MKVNKTEIIKIRITKAKLVDNLVDDINIKEETIKKVKKPNRIVYLQPKQRDVDA